MKSVYYIRCLIGLSLLALSGCAETPIKKTNCWSAAPVVTRSASDPAALSLSTSGGAGIEDMDTDTARMGCE